MQVLGTPIVGAHARLPWQNPHPHAIFFQRTVQRFPPAGRYSVLCKTRSSMAEPDGRAEEQGGEKKHVVVCGAGVIGSCTAYFLAQKAGVRVTVVERTGVACAASGKAGGFLAADWSDGSPLGPLSRASFALHAQLADTLDGNSSYGYRRVETLQVGITEGDRRPHHQKAPAWLDGPVKSVRPMGSTKTTAQVHPELFTKRVLAAAEKFGARVVTGDAQEVKTEAAGGKKKVTGVVVSGEFVAADGVVVAMGPWSATNALVSSLTTISAIKAHSIVIKPKGEEAITPHSLFLAYGTRDGRSLDPEVYPRPSGEVYLCGQSETVDVPADAAQVRPRKEAITMLQRVAGTVSTRFQGAELVHEQACFLPCSEDGLPVIGKIPDVNGGYVATGHSCWGILNAPATGASLAELIAEGASKTVDLKAFDPARFRVDSLRRMMVR